MEALAAVDEATRLTVSEGDVLQTAYLGGNADSHCWLMSQFCDFPSGAKVLDSGCGVGGISLRLKVIRPDLDITLLNFSQLQLDMCPDFRKVCADAERTGLNEKFDAVILASAACQMNGLRALKESARLLSDGGFIVLSDLATAESINLRESMHAEFLSESDWLALIRRAGLRVQEQYAVGDFDVTHFAERIGYMPDWLASAKPILWKLVKDNALDRHERVAFQFSGGKDSMAALLAMKDEWHRMTVYFMDAGDLLPETYDFVYVVAKDIPDFRVINSDSKAIRQSLGHPSDLVSTSRSYAASILSGSPYMQVDTHTCCYQSIMKPMHDRMIEDGITLIIRGQKASDGLKGRLVSGDVLDGIEYLFPIEHLNDAEVMDCLENIQLPAYYNDMTNAPDCKSCTGWWQDGRMTYLAKYHPEIAKDYASALVVFRGDLAKHISDLDAELKTYMRSTQ